MLLFFITALTTGVLAARNAGRRLRSRWLIPVLVLLPSTTATLALAPYVGWARGFPADYAVATALAVLGGVAGLTTAALIGRWAFRPRAPRLIGPGVLR